jgi:membrane protein implicated in regulation of membrane protease activity
MQVWHYWVIAGIVLLILEIFTPAFLLASFGIAALCAALAAYLGAATEIQILVFAIASLVFFFGVRPLYFKLFKRFDSPRRTGVEALIGQSGLVIETIDGAAGTGRVKIGGEDWRAIHENESTVSAGTQVIVTRVEGASVYVQNADKGE